MNYRIKSVIMDYLQLLAPAGLLVALDQWTKHLVRQNLAVGQSWSPWEWLEPLARIRHIHNTGAAFGFFQGGNTIFMILAVIVSLAILYYYPQVPRKDTILRIAMVLQLAGAVGNLIDRIQRGYVTDFISVGSFAIFNVADASISVGVAVLLLGMLWKERFGKDTGSGQEPGEEPPAPTELERE